MRVDLSSLVVALRLRPGATHRVICCPHAGAGVTSAAPLADRMGREVEVSAVNLRARRAGPTEPDLLALADEVAATVTADARPYTLFGSGAGALLAFLIAQRTRPDRLVVASFPAPDVAVLPQRLHDLPPSALWSVVLDQGGVPAELARHDDLRLVFEPALRNDFSRYAGYRHRPAPPLDAPITVLYGRRDGQLTRGGLLGWRRQTRHRLELVALPGGHWLVDQAPDALAAVIGDRITRREGGSHDG